MAPKGDSNSYAERNRAADTVQVEPKWISPAESRVMHDLLLVHYGGVPGFRDEPALGAALAAPRERFTAGCRSLAQLATAYILAIIDKQPFQAGNVAIAFLVGMTFLRVNGRVFRGSEVSAAEDTGNLAAGKCPESFYAHWLYANTCE